MKLATGSGASSDSLAKRVLHGNSGRKLREDGSARQAITMGHCGSCQCAACHSLAARIVILGLDGVRRVADDGFLSTSPLGCHQCCCARLVDLYHCVALVEYPNSRIIELLGILFRQNPFLTMSNTEPAIEPDSVSDTILCTLSLDAIFTIVTV